MDITNKKLKNLLQRAEITKELGLIFVEGEDIYIIYDYRNDVFVNYKVNDEEISLTDKQIEITKTYINE